MKNTRKLLAAVMALTMVSAIAPMSAFAVDDAKITQDSTTKSGAMTATYNVQAAYTVTIPAGVTLSDTETVTKDITADDVMLESGQKITVKLTEASNTESGASFSAKTTKGDSTATYTIGKGEATTGISVGDTVAEFTENGTQALTFSKASGATYAGAHTETLTFGISTVPKYADKVKEASKNAAGRWEFSSFYDGTLHITTITKEEAMALAKYLGGGNIKVLYEPYETQYARSVDAAGNDSNNFLTPGNTSGAPLYYVPAE